MKNDQSKLLIIAGLVAISFLFTSELKAMQVPITVEGDTDFGDVTAGTSVSETVMVNNDIGFDLEITVSITGSNASDFSVSASNFIIPSGSGHSFDVIFSPPSPGSKTADLNIKWQNLSFPADSGTFVKPLSGNGIETTSPILYVDQSATGGANDGSSWNNAYTDLQDALADAENGSEIRVAEGLYTPISPDDPNNVTESERQATFQLKNGVEIQGGYPSGGGPLASRDWETNETILSGDIDGNDDAEVITNSLEIQGSNSYTVVTGGGTNETARLDGFIITAGDGSSGMVNETGSSPTLTNLLFSGNIANEGGGMFNSEHSDPILTNVTFTGNSAGSHGGGMFNWDSGPILTNVTFARNGANEGGGIFNLECAPTLKGVTFVSNHAGSYGGGMFNSASGPILTNVTFRGNSAEFGGGGMANEASSNPTLTNVILWSNVANNGAEIFNDGSTPIISHSLIQNSGGSGSWDTSLGTDGGGNIDADPQLAAGGNLQPFSPAIDAGTADTTGLGLPATDLNGSVRVKGTVDIGANESGLHLEIPGSEGWRMMASPLASQSYAELLDTLWTQGATGADVSGGTPNVYTWDEATASFQAVSDMSNVPGAGSGLVHFVFDDQDFDATPDGFPKQLSVTGNESSGLVGIGVSSTDENSGGTIDGDEGWNLLGNPFSTPISVDAILSAAQAVDPSVNANVYVWDHSSSSYTVFPESNGHTIAPWQSFWVKYTDVGVNGTLSLDRATAKTDSATFQKAWTPRGLNFILSRDQLNSSFKIILDEDSKTGPDRNDAYLLAPLSSQYVNLYSNQDEVALAHNHLPVNLDESIEIPLYVDAGSDRSTLRLSWKPEQLPKGWEFSLKDTQTGRIISLTKAGQYSFEVESTKEKTKTLDQVSTPDPPQHGPVPTVLKAKATNPRFVLAIHPDGTNHQLADIPDQAELNQNYPNPFNPTTVIRYGVPKQTGVQLNVYDALGRKVRTLINEQKSAGRYEASFNASELASGLYFYRLKVANDVITKKMMLIK